MIKYWRKINIDNYITNLKEYFIDCTKGNLTTGSTIDTLDIEEKAYLNEKLNLDIIIGGDQTLVLNKVLQDKSKFNFTRHLLNNLSIELEVNNLDETKKSVFELIIENVMTMEEHNHHQLFISLYKRGYINTSTDQYYLTKFYKTKIYSQKLLVFWCLVRICFILHNPEKIIKIFYNERLILTLLSFKFEKPVGLKFPKLLGVANNAVEHYSEQGDLILYAMKYYKVYDSVRQQDKKGTFKLKEEKFLKFKPIQDIEFNEIVYEIFSELRH